MQLRPRMKAVLLTLAITGMIAVTSGSAQARHRHRGCCGGCGGYSYYRGGGCGGGCATGGCAMGGCATGGCATGGCATGGCATGGCATGGCAPMAAAYQPAPVAAGQPNNYSGTNYENAPPTPAYAPGTYPQQTYAPGTYAPQGTPAINGQRGDTAEQHNAARPPAMSGAPQPNGDTAGQHNATAPPAPGAAAPSPGSTSDTAKDHNTSP
jgi:hypothetical protein